MKSLAGTIILLALTSLATSSLLEMSQVFWSRVLGGGYQRIGKLDPLVVPLVKVDQSEGNTTYRVTLRNLEISGLNGSTIESVKIVRGSLKSNLSDNEAGYVSFNEQRDLDSVRYRFHTLIKEPKTRNGKNDQNSGNRLERILDFDPAFIRAGEESDFLNANAQAGQREGNPQQEQKLRSGNNTYQTPYADMKVAISPLAKNPSSVRLVYTQDYKNMGNPAMQSQNENARPCIGACGNDPNNNGRIPPNLFRGNEDRQTRIYSNQRLSIDRMNNNQGAASGDFAVNAQFGRPEFSNGNTNRNPGADFTVNYRSDRTRQFSQPNGQRPNQFAGNGQFARGDQFSDVQGSASSNYEIRTEYVQPTSYSNFAMHSERNLAQKQPCDSKENYRTAQRSPVQQSDRFRSPLTRIEKQPGYVDIIYASENKQGSESRLESVKVAPPSDPRAYGFEELVRELQAKQRYIIHNFTEGESLNKRNDAARVAAESKRLRDLIRYAKEYQEMQGFFEEGMELIYHFGSMNGTEKSNSTLNRRKRQQLDDKEEENLMHVVVRVRVPMLSVKSGYALIGKVGEELVRGNGLLAGNFTNVTGDFTVELKRVDNRTMIVRAARAKLLAEDRKLDLQGMNQTDAMQTIFTHGLMAAEAVAAMIADDLATKALSDGNANGMIYKMYKNLPVARQL